MPSHRLNPPERYIRQRPRAVHIIAPSHVRVTTHKPHLNRRVVPRLRVLPRIVPLERANILLKHPAHDERLRRRLLPPEEQAEFAEQPAVFLVGAKVLGGEADPPFVQRQGLAKVPDEFGSRCEGEAWEESVSQSRIVGCGWERTRKGEQS